jgi:hypothetical protein
MDGQFKAIGFWRHQWLAIRHSFREFGVFRDMVLGTIIALFTLGIQVRAHLIPTADWQQHKMWWVLSFVLPYIIVLGTHALYRVAVAPWKLYQKAEKEQHDAIKTIQEESRDLLATERGKHQIAIDAAYQDFKTIQAEVAELTAENEGLRNPSGEPSLAEEDPKVYLDPLNTEFIESGLLPFEMSNRGQRVNVAHRVTVQPIEILPTVFFDYVDHLDMAERKKLFPKIRSENVFTSGDMLRELMRAFDSHGELETHEVPFDIAIKYENAEGSRKFESIVSMRYSIMEEHAARRSVGKNVTRREYKILRVTDMRIRRLA